MGDAHDDVPRRSTTSDGAAAERGSNSRRPPMLVVTNLDIWSLTSTKGVAGAGNQDMYSALLGYAEAGYDVHVLTTSENLRDVSRVGEHILVHRVRLPFRWLGRLTRNWFGRKRSPTSGGGVAAGISNIEAGQSVRFWLTFQCVALVHGLRLWLRHRFSLVCGYEVLGAPSGYLLSRLMRVPCVTRFQGTELSPLISQPGRLRRLYWTMLLSYRIPAELVVMANDGTEGDRMLVHVGQDPRRCGFWMNGVDKTRVLQPDLDVTSFRRMLGIPDDRVLVLTSVRLVNWKRYDRALRALAIARRKTDRFTYLIIGHGPMRESLELLVRELNLADRVRFLGALPHTEVMAYVNACDIYLSVNDLSNLGNPLIEATLCGRCIVTLDNGATHDLITHDVNGLLLPPQDEAALGEALARLIENPAERARLAAGARQRAAMLQTWRERMRLELEALHRNTRGRTLPPPRDDPR